MKKFMLLGSVLLAILAVFVIWRSSSTVVAARSVTLMVIGPDGQKFTGNYIADGKTNVLSGIVPTIINVRATELTYRFEPEDRREEFRVNLDVDDLHRTSFVSYKGNPVKGGWKCRNDGESSW